MGPNMAKEPGSLNDRSMEGEPFHSSFPNVSWKKKDLMDPFKKKEAFLLFWE